MIRKTRGKMPPALAKRRRRRLSVRARVSGTAERPRLTVHRSNRNLFAQVVDDAAGRSLFSVRTFGKDAVPGGSTLAAGRAVGVQVAARLKERGVSALVLDRGGRKYHGVLAAVADGARENGVKL